MSSMSKSNNFLLRNGQYNKDNVFDHFDINNLVSNDLKIPKTSLNNFLYYNEMNKIEKKRKFYFDADSLIKEINTNHFNIKIDKLVIKYPNDYTVKFLDEYTPVSFIGQGSFGLVLSVIKNKTKEHFAVKIIQKDYRYSSSTYLNEVELLKKFAHPRIMKLYDVIDTEDYLFLFVDLIEGGSLKDFLIERYTHKEDYFIKDSECSIIIKGILEGLNYLHKNNVMHRDLKPENIMFKNKNDLNSLIICDFGIACEISNYTFTKSKCGTLLYMAPEIILNRPYDHLVDLWSCGIILYILESGGKHPLFIPDTDKDVFIHDIKAKTEWNFPNFFPFVARNLFMKLCKHEAFFRYQTNKALKHPWITRNPRNDIPLTLVEVYEKEDKIRTFKHLLMSMTFLRCYKENKLKEVPSFDFFTMISKMSSSEESKLLLSPHNESFNESNCRKERKGKMPIANKNKLLELLLTPIKKDLFNSTRGYYNSNLKQLRALATNRSNHTKVSFFNCSGNKTLKNSKMNPQIGRHDSQRNIREENRKIISKNREVYSKEKIIKKRTSCTPSAFLKVNKSPVRIMHINQFNKRNNDIHNTNNTKLLLLREIKVCKEKDKIHKIKDKMSFVNTSNLHPKRLHSSSSITKLPSKI